MTMGSRSSPEAPSETALTTMEIKVLDRLAPDKPRDRNLPAGIGCYAVKIARLGGYLARSRDPPPGNTVMWRGLSRLTDIMLGMTMAGELVGN